MNIPAVSTELKKDSKFLSYIIYKIISNKTRVILNGVFGLLSLPAFALAVSIIEFVEKNGIQHDDGLNDLAGILTAVGVVSSFGILILTYLSGVASFDYYYKRNIVDMNYSLPLTRKERFFGDFIAGLSPIFIIGGVSALLAIGILATGAPILMSSFDFDAWRVVWGGFFSYLVLLVYIFSFVAFSTALCGRYFEAAVYPFVLSGLIPGIISLFYGLLFIHPSLDFETELANTIFTTSPLGFLIGSFINVSRDAENIPVFNPVIIIPILLIISGLIYSSFVIAKKRITERVGLPFVFKYVYHIYLGAIMFCLTAPFIATSIVADSAMLVGLIAATGIPFLVIEVITNRGFKKMGIAAVKYVGMVGGAALLSFILTSFDGFKLYAYVPGEGSIDYVKFSGYQNISANENLIGTLEEKDDKGWNASLLTYKDPENIKLIRDFHSNNIHKDVSNLGSSAQVQYVLKSGKIVSRRIFTNYENKTTDLEPLYRSAEYRNKEIDALSTALNMGGGSVRFFDFLDEERLVLTVSEKKEFLNAFKTDYLSQTGNEYLGEFIATAVIEVNDKNSAGRYSYGVLRFDIYSSYENTCNFLEKTKFDTEVDLSNYAMNTLSIRYEGERFDADLEDNSISPEGIAYHSEGRGGLFGRTESTVAYQHNVVEIPPGWDTDEDVVTLLKNSTTYYEGYSLPRYEISLYSPYSQNRSFYVPVDYHELAEKICKKYQ